MKLFSEKVEPTFTNSTFNILQVENYSEIFFDVYEIELNKIKYPAEKISSFRGNPVVSVPVVIGEKEQEFPFVLIKGSESIFFNESNIEVPIDDTPVEVEDTDVLFESVDIDHDHRIKEDTKREIMEHIENAKLNARNHAEAIKRDKLKEADTEIRKKNKLLKESLNTAKQQLVKEFISITKSIKRELINEADDKYSELTLTIDNKINDLADTLAESIQSDFENSSKELETNIRAFVKAIHNESVLPELRKSLETIATDAVVRIKGIESDLDKKLTEKVDVSVIEELTSELDALRNSNIELNNTLNKGVNKALSRVGNVSTRLDEAVADITKQVDDKISATADNISSYYSDKLQVLEDQTFELNEKSRQYVVDIVRESRDNLISEIRKIQKEAPVEFVIESAGKKKTKTFDSIQKDIDKKISDRVSDEVIKLRKYIAVYSGGGGTVAQQFADGGVMNGDLIVNGDIFSNGSQVAALVDPVKTTLNGNGILSSFPISGAEGLINPSALTVAIDGVLQEPIVDYTVSGGNITFSDPIPLGCKAVIISPVNSLQISQMIPADGSVTSSKLDNSLNLAGNLTVGGNVGIGATTPTAKLNILDTTLAGSAGLSGSALNIAQTWNTNLTPTALSVNVTDLSSNAASQLMDLRVGGVSRLSVDKLGLIALPPVGGNGTGLVFGGSSVSNARAYIGQYGVRLTQNLALEWSSNTNLNVLDLFLMRDSANTLAQRNGLKAQESRIYSTYTNAANYERFFIKTNVGATSATQIGLSAAGSGQNRSLEFVTGGSTRMTITSAGNVGIGTSTPTTKLEITTAGSADGIKLKRSDDERVAWLVDEGSGSGALFLFNGANSNSVFITGNGNSFLNGGNVGIGTGTPTAKLGILDTTLAGSGGLSGSALNIAQTWNTNLTPTALSVNVTDLSSNASSLLMDLQVGGTSKFKVSKGGSIFSNAAIGTNSGSPGADGLSLEMRFPNCGIGTNSNGDAVFYQNSVARTRVGFGVAIASNQSLGFTNAVHVGGDASVDTIIRRDDVANTLAQRNGLNPQEYRLYNKFNNASDYERFFIKTNVGATSATQIGLSAAGTGQNRNLEFVTGGSTKMTISSGGNVGIGTAIPGSGLHVSGALGTNTTTRDSAAALKLTNTSGISWLLTSGVIGVMNSTFCIRQENTVLPALTITATTNNIGIGTNSPTEKLTVVGNISATGVVAAGSMVKFPTYSAGAPPTAAGNAGAMIYVSDDVDGPTMAFCNGSNWLRVRDNAIVTTAP